MAREYREHPAVSFTDPKHGTFRILIQDGSQIMIEPMQEGASPSSPTNQHTRRYLAIRGVEHYTSAQLFHLDEPEIRTFYQGQQNETTETIPAGFRVTPGDYQRGDERIRNWGYRTGLYATRQGSFSTDSTTPAAKRALIAIFEEVANNWNATAEAEALRVAGALASLNNEARNAEEHAEEAEQQAADLRAKVRHLDEQIAEQQSHAEHIERRTAANRATRAGA